MKTFNANGKVPPSVPAKRPLKSNPSTTSLYGTDVVSDEHKSLVECISKHVLFGKCIDYAGGLPVDFLTCRLREVDVGHVYKRIGVHFVAPIQERRDS